MVDTDKAGTAVRTPRRYGTMTLAALAVCVLAAGTFVIGRWTAPLTRASQAADLRPPSVTVAVAERQIVETIDLSATVRPAVQYHIPLIPPPEAARAVVTGAPIAVGAKVDAGGVLTEVSGRPTIALSGAVPSYRDLRSGDTGPDVKQLQEALRRLNYSVATTGVFDPATESAVAALYRDRGYGPPTTENGPGLPAREVAFFPTLPVKVTALPGPVGADPTGREITAESAGPGTIVAQLAAAASQGAPAGTPVVVRCGEVGVRGRLAAPEPAAPTQQQQTDGAAVAPVDQGAVARKITVSGPGPDVPNGTICAGTGTVAITPGPVTAVPASAVYQTVDQGPVVRPATVGMQPIPVTIGRSGDGWLEITDPPAAVHPGAGLLASVTP